MGLCCFRKNSVPEDDCRRWLFKTLWPEGFRCQRCGHNEYTLLEFRYLYMCKACRYQASLTAGTILHKTKTPLLKWFVLIYRMATSKTGVSVAEMQRELEIKDYKTVWVMTHKIRKAMAERDSNYKFKATSRRNVTDLTVAFGLARLFIGCLMPVPRRIPLQGIS